jgi:hypothetical protein
VNTSAGTAAAGVMVVAVAVEMMDTAKAATLILPV